MATKQSKAPRKTGSASPAAEVLVDDEGYFRIPRLMLMEYRAKDSECRHAHLALRVIGQELDALLTKYPDVQKKIAEKAVSALEANNKAQILRALHADIEKTFGVSVNDISIDDESGRIHLLVNGTPEETPLKPNKKPKKTPPKDKRAA